jgi:GNAT superfamily N-acetyltransferase
MGSEVELTTGYLPGCIGRVVELHGTYYHKHWNFGAFFEVKVANELSEFMARYNRERDCLWTVSLHHCIEGSITIDGIHGEARGGHLRWFIVSDTIRGKGIGNQLMKMAADFCRDKKYKRIYLWTFEGLGPARHLYEKFGFGLVEERRGFQWGKEVNEQRFELVL